MWIEQVSCTLIKSHERTPQKKLDALFNSSALNYCVLLLFQTMGNFFLQAKSLGQGGAAKGDKVRMRFAA